MGKDTGIQLNDSLGDSELMDIKVDVKRDAGGRIVQGMVIGDTLSQNQSLIILLTKGEYKFRPDLGVNMADALLDDDLLPYRHSIKEELLKDGMRVSKLELYENKPFELIADYDS